MNIKVMKENFEKMKEVMKEKLHSAKDELVCARCQGFRSGGGGSSRSSSSGSRSESRLEGSLAEEKRAGEAGTGATFGPLGPGV